MPTCGPRRVYIDLGVNWCNTILQYRQYEPRGRRNVTFGPWEVFGFEASPLIQPYVEDHVAWLDKRQANMPILCVPPAGSSKHLALWAPHYGCPAAPADAMRNCVWQKLALQLANLRPRPQLNESALVHERLRAAHRVCPSGTAPPAATPDAQRRTRFTFIPAAAAASSSNGWLWIWSPAEQTIRGGGHPFAQPTVAGHRTTGWFRVRTVDVGAWLLRAFSPRDHIVLKMDIEGYRSDLT
jgi:hypothetical protein